MLMSFSSEKYQNFWISPKHVFGAADAQWGFSPQWSLLSSSLPNTQDFAKKDVTKLNKREKSPSFCNLLALMRVSVWWVSLSTAVK